MGEKKAWSSAFDRIRVPSLVFFRKQMIFSEASIHRIKFGETFPNQAR
jgi:hypothetical protein